jgi:hypothetical protein
MLPGGCLVPVVVLVIADFLVGDNPHTGNGEDEKGNNYQKDAHGLYFLR